MAMLQMLSEVIGTEELLGLIAFAKFVHVIEMLRPGIPVGGIGELFTAIPAHVDCSRGGR